MRLYFIGEDGSLGLRKGHRYEVKLYRAINNKLMVEITVKKKFIFKERLYCPYRSLKTFADNWQIAPY